MQAYTGHFEGGGKVGLDKSKSGRPVGRAKTSANVKATVGGE